MIVRESEVLELLRKARIVRTVDYRDHCPYQNQDGGWYWFSTSFTKVGSDSWEVQYGTSANLPFCKLFWGFMNCSDCPDYIDGRCTATPYRDNTKTVISVVIDSLEDPRMEVSILGSDGEVILYKPAKIICGHCFDRHRGEVFPLCPYK